MPVVEEKLASLAGSETSRKYTGFITNDRHYEFNRMPFRLVSAPSVFQDTITRIVSQLTPGEAIPNLDDIIIPSIDVEPRLTRLKNFLIVLSKSGLTLRSTKRKFLTREQRS